MPAVIGSIRPAVSVVIAAYTEQRWDDLVAAIESLDRQTVPPVEIVVVVDHNPPLLDRVRVELPYVLAVPNRQRRGLSGARNTGIECSAGTIIAFLDDDAVAEETWLERLIEPYNAPNVVGVGGAVEPVWVDGKPAAFPDEFLWVVGCTYRGLPETTTPIRNPIGANMSFRRSVFEEIGPFRPGIGRVGTRPVGCEETELSIRVRQRWPEAVIVHEPRARVRHRVPGSRATASYFVSRCYSEGVSKALVARLVGSRDGLSSERAYVLMTLRSAALRGLADGLRGDRHSIVRVLAIVTGFAATTLGYLIGHTHAVVRRNNVGAPRAAAATRSTGA